MGIKMKIKAIALDLDGTLVGDDHHVSAKNKQAIRRAAEGGIHIILSSGRPYSSVRKIAEEIELPILGGSIVSYNGAYVRDMKMERVLAAAYLPQGMCEKLERFMTDWKRAEILTYDNTSMLLTKQDHPFGSRIAEGLLLPIRQLPDFTQIYDTDICKFIIAGESELLQQIYLELEKQFSPDINCIYGGGNFIEIMPPGVTKATGIDLVLKEYGITPEQLMCCGDSRNDLAMMQYAGYPVAMANASAEIREQARYITASYDKDGVAEAILRMGF